MTVAAAEAALDAHAAWLGAALGVDGPALLRERSALLGVAPAGRVSAGGSCRLLPAADGRWVAMNLSRRADTELLAAWMGHEWDGPPWDAVETALATNGADDAVERAQLLGIPAAVAVDVDALPSRSASAPPAHAGPPPALRGMRVLDLSAMWAGPLCARLLGALGATVTKAELRDRPDGARGGPPAFWRALNGAKREIVVDGSADLAPLLDAADVVVTSARPRALAQLGLDLDRRVDAGLVWVAVTGYGLSGPWRDRVAFGDDAAVAGGLAVAAGGPAAPVFVGDAPADPLGGLAAANGALAALAAGTGTIVDVALRDVVAHSVTRQYHRYDQQPRPEWSADKEVA
jgi:hypothetical protein